MEHLEQKLRNMLASTGRPDLTLAIISSMLAWIITAALRERVRIENQQQVHVRGIVELAASKFAHCDNGKAPRLGIRHPFGDCQAYCLINGLIRKIGEEPRDVLERQLTGKVAERNSERQPKPSLP